MRANMLSPTSLSSTELPSPSSSSSLHFPAITSDVGKQKKNQFLNVEKLEFSTPTPNTQTSSATSVLCCCEYINKNDEKSHILATCCYCVDFDLAFTQLITCRRVNKDNRQNMLLTFQDRLRIPWRGGAKKILLDAIIPIVVLPLVIGIAAINCYTAVVIFCACFLFLGYFYYYVKRTLTRTRFFAMWLLWSIVYMVLVFEFAVPLLEILPEENIILFVLSGISIFCLWQTRKRAALNQVLQSTVAEDELPDITEATAAEEEEVAQTTLLLEHDMNDITNTASTSHHHQQKQQQYHNHHHHHYQPNICASCHKYVQPRTSHCKICGTCILRRDHHSYWLNCCIGQWNHRFYLSGLLFAFLALLLGANLTMTAVCHPFLIVRLLRIPIMLPDDCSEVFDSYDLGLSFVVACYAIVMAGYIIFILLQQLYLISRGLTLHESQQGQSGNYKTIWHNWGVFLH